MGSTVSWVLQTSIKDGQAEAFKALMDEMVASTKDEPGALAYEWYISEDGGTVHIYERYADSAAVMVHMAGFGANYAERFLGCVDPAGFTVYGEPDGQVREALAGFGPVHMGTFGGFAR